MGLLVLRCFVNWKYCCKHVSVEGTIKMLGNFGHFKSVNEIWFCVLLEKTAMKGSTYMMNRKMEFVNFYICWKCSQLDGSCVKWVLMCDILNCNKAWTFYNNFYLCQNSYCFTFMKAIAVECHIQQCSNIFHLWWKSLFTIGTFY